jgi:hypothetical protein
LRPPAIWSGRAKTRGLIACATGTDCRSFVCATVGCCQLPPGR